MDSFERHFEKTGYFFPFEAAIMDRFNKDPNYSAEQALDDLTDELMAIDFEPDCSGAWQELIQVAEYSDSEDSASPGNNSKSSTKKESPTKEKSVSSSTTSSKGQGNKSSSENDNNNKNEDGRKREEDPDEGEDRQGCLQIHQQGNQEEELFQVKMSRTARNCPTLDF